MWAQRRRPSRRARLAGRHPDAGRDSPTDSGFATVTPQDAPFEPRREAGATAGVRHEQVRSITLLEVMSSALQPIGCLTEGESMSTSTSLTVVLVDDPMQKESIAVAGFLAGYCGSTRRSYATDLRLFSAWCHEANLTLFSVRRAHLELFGRWMEETGRMRSTVARRLSTLASFYKYCEQEQLVDRNPALNVRRPKVDYESRTLGLDRNELGAFLVQAGLRLAP